ncbi:hypothetical protein D8Y20_09085 [Mariprofundus sp. EBB-1]|nr:hypothetical protein D8Y20_09085 [Mariprofundus sp. EBB-1]
MKYLLLMGLLVSFAACSLQQHAQTPKSEKAAHNSIAKSMDHEHSFFVTRKGVRDGYVFIFHVMPAPEGEGFSRENYHLMVSVEKDGQAITDLTLYADVKHPDGTIQKKAPMMQMGAWYMALYNLSHEMGQHWLTVSFEHQGKSYSSGVYYPERVYHE